ncbi:MAG: chorismate synthase [Lentihominibacter sp.]|jgi:chorismate synthase/shikimate 5-dehydrogenase/shikimate kinase
MKSTFGKKLKVTIWGGSHEPSIGVDIEGFPPHFVVDMQELQNFLKRRAPGNNIYTTSRKEPDIPIKTGTFSYEIRNTDTRRSDYEAFRNVPRPGHADYTARLRYGENMNMSGGGPFSGRMTAPLCVAGGIALQYLKTRGISINARISSIGGETEASRIEDALRKVIESGDSLGGTVECVAEGLPAGIGGAMYDGIESILSPILFGIPGVKGVEFGKGVASSALKGSENNDAFRFCHGRVITVTNNSGGILGGITTGMPLTLKVAFKPTPSIAAEQESINLSTGESATISVVGRHDPCIAIRAVPVVEAAVALGLLDAILITEEDKSTEPYTRELFNLISRISLDLQANNSGVFGLVGENLSHSFSRDIHEALGRYKFNLYSLSRSEMVDFIESRQFDGLTVTIPYKQEVFPLCDEVSDLAQEIGAINLIYRDRLTNGERKLIGHNTDYEGFLFTADRAGINFDSKTVLILGSGGTSRTVNKAVTDRGALKVFHASRNEDGYSRLREIANDIDIIVNTTPVGTYPNNMESLISLDDFPECEAVIDVIYNPFLSALLLDARAQGMKYANGLPMLVAQATAAAGYFLGTPGGFAEKNEEIIAMLERKLGNVVLIGMPGSGKTTLGKALAEATGLKFVDTDHIVAERAGRDIAEIFAGDGEETFRQMETDVILESGKEHGQVIATGGGAVLSETNMRALKQNGTIIWIKRPVDNLATEGRPLSNGHEALKKIADERLPLYERWADVAVDLQAIR